jgi:hypothetical protein
MATPTPEELNHLATLADQVQRGIAEVQVGMGAAYHLRTLDTLPRLVQEADKANDTARSIVRRLIAMGASRPGKPAPVDTLPLELLDTPATRRLVEALETAASAAADVDRERGWIDADGEPSGIGETLAGLLYQWRRDVYGPSGKD